MKKLNLVVGILVAAAIIVLLALLVRTFFIDETANKPAPTPTPTVSTNTPTPTPTPTDNSTGTPQPSAEAPSTPTGAALEGEKLTLEAFIGREKLTFTYSSELFTRMPTEIGEQFFLKSDTTNETVIEIVFKEGDLELYKASFLDAYVPDFVTMDALGQVLIAGSSVAAEGLSATNNVDNYAEAWLIDVQGGFFAVVAKYADEVSRAELYRMLDTLEFSL